ncbi:MAG TPA: MFS transporter [Candidatus Dormibacteraeota bacterium]|nr:MFS transporter [Candidatus Dormibacteraeota bacterium]
MSLRILLAIALATILNPLNSSMIAVALVPIHVDFRIDVGTSTWLVSAFYLTGAVAQPLMGRLADLWGARRVFLTGAAVACVVCALAPLSPSFGWLVTARALQALGTSTAFPSGMGLIRAAAGNRIPSRALAVLSVAASTSAALGPTIGGLLLAQWGWQAIFLVNVPLTVAAIGLGLRWLPAPPPADPGASGLASVDLPGVALFAATLTSILGALLALGSIESYVLLALVPVAAALLAARELRFRSPFFDLRLLLRNPAIVAVFLQFAAVTFIFYSFFFGLPIWLEQVGRYDARAAGLLVLPLTGIAIVVTPLAARLIERRGPRLPLILGSVFLVAGTLMVLLVGTGAPVLLILAAGFLLGVPNGFNNLGLQAALYASTPPERISWAAGQYQTFRYVGATLAGAVLGSVFRHGATTAGLHGMAVALAAVAAVLVVVSMFGTSSTAAGRRSRSGPPPPGASAT